MDITINQYHARYHENGFDVLPFCIHNHFKHALRNIRFTIFDHRIPWLLSTVLSHPILVANTMDIDENLSTTIHASESINRLHGYSPYDFLAMNNLELSESEKKINHPFWNIVISYQYSDNRKVLNHAFSVFKQFKSKGEHDKILPVGSYDGLYETDVSHGKKRHQNGFRCHEFIRYAGQPTSDF